MKPVHFYSLLFTVLLNPLFHVDLSAQIPGLTRSSISVGKSLNAKTGYNASTHTYKPEYFKPGSMRWKINIRHCINFPKRTITIPAAPPDRPKPIISEIPGIPANVKSFRWEISNSTGFSQTKTQSCDCEFDVTQEGAYTIKVSALDQSGRAISVSQQGIMIKDRLILSFGDSYASGEGAPDKNAYDRNDAATYTNCEALTTAHIIANSDRTFNWDQPAEWLEPSAHRSLQNGHAKAALALAGVNGETYNTITFLSAATSGAVIRDLTTRAQESWQSSSQIDEIKKQVGERPVDAIILTIGGNDISWVPTLTRATILPSSREDFNKTYQAIKELPAKYQQLNTELRMKFPRLGKILITEYPVDFFSNDSGGSGPTCGVFKFMTANLSNVPVFDEVQVSSMFANIDNHEVDLMRAAGLKLNATIAQAAQSNGWIYINGVHQAFTTHGYCARDSYYTDASTSCKIQGNFKGMLHPNVKGYEAMAKLIKAQLARVLTP